MEPRNAAHTGSPDSLQTRQSALAVAESRTVAIDCSRRLSSGREPAAAPAGTSQIRSAMERPGMIRVSVEPLVPASDLGRSPEPAALRNRPRFRLADAKARRSRTGLGPASGPSLRPTPARPFGALSPSRAGIRVLQNVYFAPIEENFFPRSRIRFSRWPRSAGSASNWASTASRTDRAPSAVVMSMRSIMRLLCR